MEYQNGRKYCKPRVRTSRVTVRYRSKLVRDASSAASGTQPRQQRDEMRREREKKNVGLRTLLLQLVQQLVMMPPQLGPFCKLVLTARSVQVSAALEKLLLKLTLLGKVSGELCWEGSQDGPELCRERQKSATTRLGLLGPGLHSTIELIVVAPIVLMACTASSMRNIITSSDSILGVLLSRASSRDVYHGARYSSGLRVRLAPAQPRIDF